MERTDAERRLLRMSLITILLGSAIVWLPVVNMLANQPAPAVADVGAGLTPAGDTAAADATPPVPWQLLLTCVLANAGIALLILLNVRVNLRRLRQARGEPPSQGGA